MELHTLGVDGGYTQKDVQEVARAFTGWTIAEPAAGRRLPLRAAHARRRREDRARPHDQGGRRRARRRAGARHPRAGIRRRRASSRPSWRAASSPTTPPPALVDRAAARFRETDGDIREVVRTILTSPEFFAPRPTAPRSRRRSSSSSARCARPAPTCASALPLVQPLRELGMPLYMCQPPTGYADRADAWVNTGALLDRMNFALALTAPRRAAWQSQPSRRSPRVAATRSISDVLGGDLSDVDAVDDRAGARSRRRRSRSCSARRNSREGRTP